MYQINPVAFTTGPWSPAHNNMYALSLIDYLYIKQLCSLEYRMILYYMGKLATLEAEKDANVINFIWRRSETQWEHLWWKLKTKLIWLYGSQMNCPVTWYMALSITNSQNPLSGENCATYSPKQNLHTTLCFLPVCVLVRTREMVDTEKYMDPVGCPI